MSKQKLKSIKPTLFIGASSEYLELAKVFQTALRREALCIGWWDNDECEPTRSTLSTLIDAAQEYDFGLFLLIPDDRTILRKKAQATPRDNVLFEFGLFLGTIGEKRTFAVTPDKVSIMIPSDLYGITTVRFQDEKDEPKPSLTVKDATRKIAELIKKRKRRQSRYLLARSWGATTTSSSSGRQLDAVKLAARRERMDGKSFVLISRNHDDREPFERDTLIAIEETTDLPRFKDDGLFVAVRDPTTFRTIQDEGRVDGQLIVVPAGIKERSWPSH